MSVSAERHPNQRMLRTILAVEAVDYAFHMNVAEEETVAELARCRLIVDSLIAAREGRIFTTAPNNVLAEFVSPVEAVRCAIEIKESVGHPHQIHEHHRTLRFRIGIHTGDVLRTGDNLLGDAVNVAARLEGIAEPNSIFVSENVKEFVEDKLSVNFRFCGNKSLKNIPRPLPTYEVSVGSIKFREILVRRVKRLGHKITFAVIAAVAVVVLIYLAFDGAQRLQTGRASQASSTSNILDKDPSPGTLAYGTKVYVNDGSCPPGQIKELTGGNKSINIPRISRCIDRH